MGLKIMWWLLVIVECGWGRGFCGVGMGLGLLWEVLIMGGRSWLLWLRKGVKFCWESKEERVMVMCVVGGGRG